MNTGAAMAAVDKALWIIERNFGLALALPSRERLWNRQRMASHEIALPLERVILLANLIDALLEHLAVVKGDPTDVAFWDRIVRYYER